MEVEYFPTEIYRLMWLTSQSKASYLVVQGRADEHGGRLWWQHREGK